MPRTLLDDPVLRPLLLANMAALVVALLAGWRMLHLLWPFWIQSVIIGVFAVRRMLAAGRASPTPGRPPDPGRFRRALAMAGGFVLHYGAFHALYAWFLVAMTFDATDGVIQVRDAETGLLHAVEVGQVGGLDVLAYVLLAAGFWRAHASAASASRERELVARLEPGQFATLAYVRIIPIHLTLALGVGIAMFTGAPALVTLLFAFLKAAADIGMQRVEERAIEAEGAKRRGGG